MKITIPGKQHPSLNSWTRWHWAKKNRIKKDWVEEIGWLVKTKAKQKYEKALVEIIYYFDNKHKRDKDNYAPKFIMDGLVEAGVITDDNTDDIFLNWKLKYDKENPRTEIIIKEGVDI